MAKNHSQKTSAAAKVRKKAEKAVQHRKAVIAARNLGQYKDLPRGKAQALMARNNKMRMA